VVDPLLELLNGHFLFVDCIVCVAKVALDIREFFEGGGMLSFEHEDFSVGDIKLGMQSGVFGL
jgi:hypothetical protein